MSTQSLAIQHLDAWAGEKQILYDISCVFEKKKIAVIMGPNGSGKSTLAHTLLGDPKYICHQHSKILLHGKNISTFPTEKKATMGLFLSFQSPVAVPGVSVLELLRAGQKGKKDRDARIRACAATLHIDKNLLTRGIHEGFSGGERKKIELLQALVLKPSYAIFDEIDTGVDVDAMKLIVKGIQELQKQGTGIILITHNERIVQYLTIDTVIVMAKGKIVKEGGKELIGEINRKGYEAFSFLNSKLL